MPWMDVNGVSLRYEVSGHGQQDLVLMHEMGGCLESWDRVVPHLTQQFRVIRFDMRGAGMSEKKSTPFAMADLADDVSGLLAQLARLFGVYFGLGQRGHVLFADRDLGGCGDRQRGHRQTAADAHDAVDGRDVFLLDLFQLPRLLCERRSGRLTHQAQSYKVSHRQNTPPGPHAGRLKPASIWPPTRPAI